MSKIYVVKAPDLAMKNRDKLSLAKSCGCYNCMKLMLPSDIKKWTDNTQTALCPFCETDCVLAETDEPLTDEVLKKVNSSWLVKSEK